MPVEDFSGNPQEGTVRTSANVYFEMGIIKTDLKNVKDDLRELRHDQKELIQFMHEIQGGKAWMISMLLLAGSIGGLLSAAANYFFRGGITH